MGPRGFPGSGLTIASPTIKLTDAPIGHGKIGGLTFGVLSVAVARGASNGTGAGKVRFNEFKIVKKSDKASAKLFKFCTNGKHFDHAIITARKAGGDPKKLVRYTLTDAVVNGFETVATGGKGSTPEENISFDFSKIKVEYPPQ
jgi:type VI secretion system secreted protein Hcp